MMTPVVGSGRRYIVSTDRIVFVTSVPEGVES